MFPMLKLAFALQDVIDSCAEAAMSFLQKSSDTIPDLDNSGGIQKARNIITEGLFLQMPAQ